MDINYILGSLVIFIMVFWYFVNLFRVMIYERKIIKIEAKKRKEINKLEQATGMTTSFFEASVKRIEKDYEPELNKLNRERQFILDRLPFIKN
jgi:hypothetical protein